MHCSKCLSEIEIYSAFCNFCGAKQVQDNGETISHVGNETGKITFRKKGNMDAFMEEINLWLKENSVDVTDIFVDDVIFPGYITDSVGFNFIEISYLEKEKDDGYRCRIDMAKLKEWTGNYDRFSPGRKLGKNWRISNIEKKVLCHSTHTANVKGRYTDTVHKIIVFVYSSRDHNLFEKLAANDNQLILAELENVNFRLNFLEMRKSSLKNRIAEIQSRIDGFMEKYDNPKGILASAAVSKNKVQDKLIGIRATLRNLETTMEYIDKGIDKTVEEKAYLMSLAERF